MLFRSVSQSRYLGSLSVDHEYLALEDGPPMFRQDFTCPALLFANLVPPPCFYIRGYHPLWPDFPDRSANKMAKDCWLFRFRSPLLSESRLISFPSPTEMFQFREFASTGLCIQPGIPLRVGFPIRTSGDQSSIASYPPLS